MNEQLKRIKEEIQVLTDTLDDQQFMSIQSKICEKNIKKTYELVKR